MSVASRAPVQSAGVHRPSAATCGVQGVACAGWRGGGGDSAGRCVVTGVRDFGGAEACAAARVVDGSAVHLHLGRLRATLDGPNGDLRLEGFQEVHVFRQPSAMDEVQIQRVGADATFTNR